MTHVRAAALGAALLALTACSATSATPTRTTFTPVPSASTTARVEPGRITPRPAGHFSVATSTYTGSQGETWAPPHPGQLHPKATWQSVWAHLCPAAGAAPVYGTAEPGGCAGGPGAQIVLARVTLPFPAKLKHDGSMTREFVDKLMYVVTWHSECVSLGGPNGLTPTPSPRPKRSVCTVRSYVDAQTGHEEYGESVGS